MTGRPSWGWVVEFHLLKYLLHSYISVYVPVKKTQKTKANSRHNKSNKFKNSFKNLGQHKKKPNLCKIKIPMLCTYIEGNQ